MPHFGYSSLKHYDSLHPDLKKVMDEAIKTFDFSILCGHRGEKEQNKAVENGASKLKWPNSRHNTFPSEAVDCAPYPLDWSDHKSFAVMAGHIMSAAIRLGIELEWGGDWKSFQDLPHFQLRKRHSK